MYANLARYRVEQRCRMRGGLFWMNPFTRYFSRTEDITGLWRDFLIIIDFGGSVVFSCCGSRLILLYVNEARSGNWFRKLLNQDSEPVKRKSRTLNTRQNIENENLDSNGPRKTIKFRR